MKKFLTIVLVTILLVTAAPVYGQIGTVTTKPSSETDIKNLLELIQKLQEILAKLQASRLGGNATSTVTISAPVGGEIISDTNLNIAWQAKNTNSGQKFNIQLLKTTEIICITAPCEPTITATFDVASKVAGSSYTWKVGKVYLTGNELVASPGTYRLKVCLAESVNCAKSGPLTIANAQPAGTPPPVACSASYKVGDINRDGIINAADSSLFASVKASNTILTEYPCADANDDKTFNATDIQIIENCIASKSCGNWPYVASIPNSQGTTTPPSTPTAAPTVDLKINGNNGPVAVVYGALVNISWTSTNAASCTPNNAGIVDPSSAYKFDTSNGPINTSGSREIKFNRTGVISITCRNSAGQTVTDPVSVNVTPAPEITALNAAYVAPETNVFVPGKGRVTLSWTTTNTQSCKLIGAQTASVLPAVGTTQVSPSVPKTFELVCYSGANLTGTASVGKKITINVSTDTDGNGRVDATDLTFVTNCTADPSCSTNKDRFNKADINRDGAVNATDQQLINNAIQIGQQAFTDGTSQTASVFESLRNWIRGLFGLEVVETI